MDAPEILAVVRDAIPRTGQSPFETRCRPLGRERIPGMGGHHLRGTAMAAAAVGGSCVRSGRGVGYPKVLAGDGRGQPAVASQADLLRGLFGVPNLRRSESRRPSRSRIDPEGSALTRIAVPHGVERARLDPAYVSVTERAWDGAVWSLVSYNLGRGLELRP